MSRPSSFAIALVSIPLAFIAACDGGGGDDPGQTAGAAGSGGNGQSGSAGSNNTGGSGTGGSSTNGSGTGGSGTGGSGTGGSGTGGSGTGGSDTGGSGTGGSGTGGTGGGATCPYTGPPIIDPNLFAPCSPACGGAHCVPALLVPESTKALLSTCEATGGEGYCAPDKFIEASGNFVPQTCTSIAGAEGRCLSTCLPDVAAQSALLPSAGCGADERCVPCFNPVDADPTAATGACSLACDAPVNPPVVLTCPWTGPDVIDPATFPSCGPANSACACVPGALIPPEQQGQLTACTGGFCAPNVIIETAGNNKPPSCVPFAGVSSAADGRCLSACLPAVSGQPTLEQSSCAAGSKCAPCFDPFTGAPTGACASSSCDAPPTPGYKFPNCCVFEGTPQGKCVPKSQIPDGQEDSLDQDSCDDGDYLCVPSEQLPGGTPIACDPGFPFGDDGTCLSECLDLGFGGIFLGQGSCPGNHKCVPCSLAPDGTPGC